MEMFVLIFLTSLFSVRAEPQDKPNPSFFYPIQDRSSKPTNESPARYCYWCGEANEAGRTTCKRCGRSL